MFGSYIKAARERAGVSVVDAAARVGIGADAIYRYERDANSPSIDVLDKLAAAYGCLAGDLMPNSGDGAGGRWRDVEAALMGLDEREIAEQILILASQARLNRNAILRRQSPTFNAVLPYTPSPTNSPKDDGGGTVYAVGAGSVKESLGNHARATPRTISKSATKKTGDR